MTKLSMTIALFVVACLLLGPAGSAADQEVNLPDHDSPTLGDTTSESEPSVAVFGSTIVVGWNDTRDPTSQWVSMGYAFSNDDGATFTNSGFLPPPPGYFYFGDPSLAVDRAGHFYFAALTIPSPPGPLGIAVSRSTSTNPLRFGPPKLITSPAGGSFDKEWIAVDTSGGTFDGRVYVAWTEFTGIDRPTSLFVTHSTRTSPLTFARPTALSEPDALNTGAMPAVGPNGDVFVVWGRYEKADDGQISAESFHIVKSTDGGGSFHNPDPTDHARNKTVAAPIPAPDAMWSNLVVPRSHDFPFLTIDQTPPGSPTRGNLYVVYQARPGAQGVDRSDIFFTASSDGGRSWSPPRSVNKGPAVTSGADATTNDNWQPAIAVSPTDGRITIVFYDRRQSNPANFDITLFRADSTDGGTTWVDTPASSQSFAPTTGYDEPKLADTYMGDYNDAVSTGTGLYLVWTDLRNLCAPPATASAPCTPAGRPDMDVFEQGDATAAAADAAPTGAMAAAGSSSLHPLAIPSGTPTAPAMPATPAAIPPMLKGYRQAFTVGCRPAFHSVQSALQASPQPAVTASPAQSVIQTDLTPVDSAELKRIVEPTAAAAIGDRDGRYALTIQIRCLPSGASDVAVSAVIIVNNPDVGNPLGGLPAPSNGEIEKEQLARVTHLLPTVAPASPIVGTPTP